jgi:hypothetical protein
VQPLPSKAKKRHLKYKDSAEVAFEYDGEHGKRAPRCGILSQLGRWLLKMGKIDGFDT